MSCNRLCVPVPAALVSIVLLSGLALAAPADPWQVLPLTEGPDLDRAHVHDVALSPLDPDRLLAWSAGLLYRSTDGGENWAFVAAQFVGEGPSPPLHGLRFDPVNLDVAWGLLDDRIVRTTDFGRTWRTWGSPAPGDIQGFELVAGAPATAWVAISEGPGAGLWRTTDGGDTWAARDEDFLGSTAWSIAARPGPPGTFLAGTGDGLARTTDDGATWNWVRIGARASQIRWSADGNVARAYQGGLVESTDAGLTWAFLPSELREGDKSYAFDPFDPAQLLLANVNWCGSAGYRYGHFGTTQRSTDGGASWIRKDLTGCLYLGYTGWSEPAGVLRAGETAWSWLPPSVSTPLALQKTTDGGETWARATAGMKELPLAVFDVDGAGTAYNRDSYGLGNAGTFRRSTDRGQTWPVIESDGYWFQESTVLEASRTRPGDLLDAGHGFDIDIGWEYIARSTNGGVDWVVCDRGLWGRPWRAGFNHGTGGTIYVWSGDSWAYPPPGALDLFRSTDGGADFDLIGASPFVPVAALVTPEDDSEVFVATSDVAPVLRTTDAGITWDERSAGLPDGIPVTLLMDPAGGDHLVVVFERGLPWESTDRGVTWRRLAAGLDPARGDPTEIPAPPDLELRGVTIRDADWDVDSGRRRVFLATDHGIWASDLGFVGTKRPQIVFDWVRYSRATGQLLAASRRHGIFALDISPFNPLGGPATAAPLVSTFAPLSLAPNPFAGSASIRFGLGRAGSARLDVFDPAGRRVATLVDGRLAAGGHSYTWSGRNDAGRSVAPGVYFVRLTTPEQQDTRRIVRVR